MRLQIATRLALYAVLQLAADPERQFAAAEIAERFGISVNHLAKVLRTLGRAGLVEAVRGAGGGYRFRGNVKRVTLLDVIQLFEDVGTNERSESDPGERSAEGRVLRRVLDEIDGTAKGTLASISLATAVKLMGVPSREGGEAGRGARQAPGRR
ncbi:MAG TPA: Rrf2 family transcriptional regulator [Anaeromyxobacteraceae bacterium]|nr:Rrf2 family transcriptional regulator [Anaeromyxobacteraceae bacterium]